MIITTVMSQELAFKVLGGQLMHKSKFYNEIQISQYSQQLLKHQILS